MKTINISEDGENLKTELKIYYLHFVLGDWGSKVSLASLDILVEQLPTSKLLYEESISLESRLLESSNIFV